MGAWGAKYFDNDDAGDFISELGAAGDWAVARAAMEAVANSAPSEYLELTAGSAAIAAAAVFAQKIGKLVGTDFPDDIEIIAALPKPPDLASLVLKVVARVRGPNSELAELWQDAGDEEWLSTLATLEAAFQ